MSDKEAILERAIRDYGDRDKFATDLAVGHPALVLDAMRKVASNDNQYVSLIPVDSVITVTEPGEMVFVLSEPCVVLYDGENGVVVPDHGRVDRYGENLNQIGRATTVARLRALANIIEGYQPCIILPGDQP